jgi:DNA-binding IclR family transcriptional regulator
VERSISGVGVLDKAVLILDALEEGPADLAGLMSRTGLARATAHRLAAALEAHGLVQRTPGGPYRLGSHLVELGRAAGRPFRSLAEVAAPILSRLRDETGESAQLYVRSGTDRVCVATAESVQGLRTIVAVGAVLPMDRGSAGRVLAGQPDRRGWAESVEEREPGVASVSAPVVSGGAVVAAVSVSGPIGRTTRQPGRRYAAAVVAAAQELSRLLQNS